jgi:hypothetical protein
MRTLGSIPSIAKKQKNKKIKKGRKSVSRSYNDQSLLPPHRILPF